MKERLGIVIEGGCYTNDFDVRYLKEDSFQTVLKPRDLVKKSLTVLNSL